jgi:hypothetical protein
MDRKRLAIEIDAAERDLAENAALIDRQRAIVARLERHSHDAHDAQDLLVRFEAIQRNAVDHRDRLRAALLRR